MPVSVHANLELLSWNELVSLKLYVECMPPNKLKNQSALLKNIQLEYQRRKETTYENHSGQKVRIRLRSRTG